MRILSIVPAVLLAGAFAAPAVVAADASAERAELIEALADRWEGHVEQTFRLDGETWRKEMAPAFEMATLAELRAAQDVRTYEAMTDAVLGLASEGGRQAFDPAKALGALGNDLVYTPIAPCRVVDTRSTSAGAIATAGTRSFLVINASNFSSQGGSATNCGTLGLNATAVAINTTVVSPANTGFVTVYPYGTARPTAATLVHAPGQLISNSSISQIPNPLGSFDITVYANAQTHVVIDIVGYFAPPVATALQCVDTADTNTSVAAGGTANSVAPACAAGYTQTATNCESSTWQMPFVYFSAGTCSAQNNSGSAATLRSSRTCCRVPGR